MYFVLLSTFLGFPEWRNVSGVQIGGIKEEEKNAKQSRDSATLSYMSILGWWWDMESKQIHFIYFVHKGL